MHSVGPAHIEQGVTSTNEQTTAGNSNLQRDLKTRWFEACAESQYGHLNRKFREPRANWGAARKRGERVRDTRVWRHAAWAGDRVKLHAWLGRATGASSTRRAGGRVKLHASSAGSNGGARSYLGEGAGRDGVAARKQHRRVGGRGGLP